MIRHRYENELLQNCYELWVRTVIGECGKNEYMGMSEETADELIWERQDFLREVDNK